MSKPHTTRKGSQYEGTVPTVADRVAQTVVAMELEKVVEPKFHPKLVWVPAGTVHVGRGGGLPGTLFHALVGVGL